MTAACDAFARLKDRSTMKPLVDLDVRARNNTIRESVGRALESITGFQYDP
ncbi:MAG: hypothetical protein ABSH20_26085 [Tepidisphaeraceae bacterium]